MLKPINTEELHIPTLNLDDFGAPSTDAGCQRCKAHRPGPQPDGNLRVDPEIHLPSPGMPVDIAWYYNSLSSYNGPFGYGRTISTNQTAQASLIPPSESYFATVTLVTLTRGNGATTGIGAFLAYTFDAASNRVLMTDTDGGLTTYAYDAQNRLSLIVNPFNEYSTFTYDALNRELLKTFGNGMTASHSYDPAGNESAREYLALSGAGLAIYTATYDSVDNRVSVLEIDGSQYTYSYDPTNQLVNELRTVSLSYNATYTYDGMGNRLVKNDSGALTTYSYNPANALLLAVNPTGQPTTSSYDANGNLILDNAGGALTTYAWDPENRMTSIGFSDGSSETNVYDATGHRQSNNVPGTGITYFVWDGENVLIRSNPTSSPLFTGLARRPQQISKPARPAPQSPSGEGGAGTK